MVEKFKALVAEHPERFRVLVFAVMVLIAGFVPGLPVDAIDAVVAAALLFAYGEGKQKVRKVRRKRSEAL